MKSRIGIVSVVLVWIGAVLGCSGPDESSTPPEKAIGGQSSLHPALAKSDFHPNGLNVVVILLDTVRADRFSCYGYEKPTTPEIDKLAAEGLRFERCYSNSSWTLPSHASLFTGHYPVSHRATQETLVLDKRLPTLAEIFTHAGYRTFASSTSGVVAVDTGLARGFETFVEAFRSSVRDEYEDQGRHPNNVAVDRFLSAADASSPFFIFLNYIEAHLPYQPPDPFQSRFLDAGTSEEAVARARQLMFYDPFTADNPLTEEMFSALSQLYDGELAYLDSQIADLIEIFERHGRRKNTLFVITSDHGENIGDHGYISHFFTVYNSVLHVPLILVLPDEAQGGITRTDIAQTVDLFPTILNACGIDYAGRYDGRDLLQDVNPPTPQVAYAEYYYPRQVFSVMPEIAVEYGAKFLPYMRRLRAVQDGTMKFIWGSDGRHELYEIASDPGEVRNLLLEHSSHPAKDRLMEMLLSYVGTYAGEIPLPPPPPVGWLAPGFVVDADPELLENLRALGYLK